MKNNLPILALLFLLTASGSYAQQLDYPQRSWLKDNAYTIHPDETFGKASWEYIFPHINDKRIILIGEFTHGAKEISIVRNDLVRFLHEKLGFNTLLFEAGIGELAAVDINRQQLNAAQMTSGFYLNGRTKENRELMNYVKTNNMAIAGFDVQRSGNTFITVFKNTARKQNLDTAICSQLENSFTILDRELANRKAVYDSVSSKTLLLIAGYQQVYDQLSVNKAGNFSREHVFTLKTIASRIRFLQYKLRFVKDRDWNSAWEARDSAMADNIRWLADSVFKNEKLIILGHNFHIAKSNEQLTVMGGILRTRYPRQMYSLGVFAGSGSYADNYEKETKMLPPDSAGTDLKHIITLLPGFTSYLNIPANKVNGTDWLHKNIVVNDTFIDLNSSNKMILAKQFDGVLLLKKVSPPDP
ncbi:MAG: erythromycin esterase family protein [Chitinophagaceae bacterium]|nr:erythromycin esterase family protein [Chitinophagaceae bacterium]